MKLQAASAENIQIEIDAIDRFNSTPEYGTTRLTFTKEEMEARSYVKTKMIDLGLDVKEDCVGNIHGILLGSKPELAPVWTGSHIDTVCNAGKFDGMAGIVAGLEALRLIKESGIPHRRNIEVIIFTSEEPTRFGIWSIGSRSMAGTLTRDELQKHRDTEGISIEEVLLSLDYNLESFSEIKKAQGDVHAFIELHIEQAPLLERHKTPIGIVEAICGPTAMNITLSGVQGHAGSTPKYERVDPIPAMSQISLYLESLIYKNGEPNLVATVGRIQVTPNASNVIPKEVSFSIDIRDAHFHTKEKIVQELTNYAETVASARNLGIKIELITHEKPIKCAPVALDAIANATNELGYKNMTMVSGAFHDAVVVSGFAPTAMIFIPCKDGISHSPDEWADYEDIRKGCDVLTHSLLELAQ